MSTVAVAIMCKTPAPGQSKTRLSPPLRPEECAAISACFIRDLSATIQSLADDGDVTGYAVYTPVGSEAALRKLAAGRFWLVPQTDGDFGVRLLQGTSDLLDAGHAGAILVNSDSPTLPAIDPARGGRCGAAGRQRRAQPGARRRLYVDRPLAAARASCSRTSPGAPSQVYRADIGARAARSACRSSTCRAGTTSMMRHSLRMLEDELAGRRAVLCLIRIDRRRRAGDAPVPARRGSRH